MPPTKMKSTVKPQNVKKTILRILSYMQGFQVHLFFAVLCIVVSAAASIAGTYFLKPLINNYILPFIGHQNPDLSDFILMLAIMAAIYLLGVAATFTYSRLMLVISTARYIKSVPICSIACNLCPLLSLIITPMES